MIGKSNLIKYIVSGSNTDTSDATAMPSDIKSSKTAYVANGKTIGTMPINNQFTYSLPVNGTYTIPEGYHDGTSIVSQNIEELPMAEYTPTTSNIVIPSGKYLTGNQVIKGEPNLIAENIVQGVTIFGISGIASPSSVIEKRKFATINFSQYNSSTFSLQYNIPTDNPTSFIMENRDFYDYIFAPALYVNFPCGTTHSYTYQAGASNIITVQMITTQIIIRPWQTSGSYPNKFKNTATDLYWAYQQ